jgi:hypothetical protein
MNIKLQFVVLLCLSLLAIRCGSKNDNGEPAFNPHPSSAYLSPGESMKTMYLPKGYHLDGMATAECM